MDKGKGMNDSKVEVNKAQLNFPVFYRFYTPEIMKRRLVLPTKYARFQEGRILDYVSLRDRRGDLFQVKLGKFEDQLCLLDGWTTFVEQSDMESGDLIVFEYDGGHMFNVKILGYDTCEKGVGSLTHKVNEDVDDTNSQQIRKEVEYHPSEKVSPFDGFVTNGMQHMKKEVEYHSSKKLDPFGLDLFNDRYISPPKNPYFITQIKEKQRNKLFIPCIIISSHTLNLPNQIILSDNDGREWTASYRHWADGRTWYSGGWRILCDTNHFAVEDICICEFLKSEEKGLYIQVKLLQPKNYA